MLTPARPSLPVELILIILRIAAGYNRQTAATLCAVSTWTRNQVEPILYRVLVLKYQSSDECSRLISIPKRTRHLHSFGFIIHPLLNRSINAVLDTLSDMDPKPRIRNLMVREVNTTLPRVFEFLEEIHLLDPSYYSTSFPTFPHLRRLHIYILSGSNHLAGPVDPECHTLTHVAFTISLPQLKTLSEFLDHVRGILEKCSSLVLVMVRLYCSDDDLLDSDKSGVHAECVQGLESIPDHRLVVISYRNSRMFREKAVEEWERNAQREGSIWDVAEAHIATLNTNTAPNFSRKPHITVFSD